MAPWSTMRIVVTILSLLLLLGFCQCNRRKPVSPLLGEYGLEAHDHSGRLVFTGTMTMSSLEQNFLTGRCVITRQQNAPRALFDINGICQAMVDGKTVSIDTAPFLDDGGLLMEGEFNGVAITGVWMFDGFVGSGPLGKFEAVKR